MDWPSFKANPNQSQSTQLSTPCRSVSQNSCGGLSSVPVREHKMMVQYGLIMFNLFLGNPPYCCLHPMYLYIDSVDSGDHTKSLCLVRFLLPVSKKGPRHQREEHQNQDKRHPPRSRWADFGGPERCGLLSGALVISSRLCGPQMGVS